MKHGTSIEDLRLNYNPEAPQERFKAAGVKAALMEKISDRMPTKGIPWPAGKAPAAKPLPQAPGETEDLTKFKGYDAVVVTWTSAEAATLAALFTPGYQTSDWYEYRHNIAAYLPLVTGATAPFNDKQADMARYYHSLGLYFPCQIGNAKVLAIKSGLHLDYDGPATPVKQLMAEIATAVSPKIFITTGTGGGIGPDVKLGDVCIAGQTSFYCPSGPKFAGKEQFSNKAQFPWNAATYKTTAVPAKALAAITNSLTTVNAEKVVPGGGRPEPKFWSAPTDTIVTTDFFGFDDSTWATRWWDTHCKHTRSSNGLQSATRPTRRCPTPITTCSRQTRQPARFTPSTARLPRRRASSPRGPSLTRSSTEQFQGAVRGSGSNRKAEAMGPEAYAIPPIQSTSV